MLDIIALDRLVDGLHPQREATDHGETHHQVEQPAQREPRGKRCNDTLLNTRLYPSHALAAPTAVLVVLGERDAQEGVDDRHQRDGDAGGTHNALSAVATDVLLRVTRNDERHVLGQEEEDESHAVHEDTNTLQEVRKRRRPQVRGHEGRLVVRPTVTTDNSKTGDPTCKARRNSR